MSSGETLQAFHNVINFIINSVFRGENLPKLLKEADYYLELMDRFDSKLHKAYVSAYRSTISMLIGEGEPNASESKGDSAGSGLVYERGAKINSFLQAFWRGHAERCSYYGENLLKTPTLGRQPRLLVTCYLALNCCRGIQSRNGRYQSARTKLKQAISTLKPAASLCPANWQGKLYLLGEFSMVSIVLQ